ncbi:hypothetical protein [uncultured Desulfuromusa sp.]|uniref:hypothetical protein n=1 Tax=uncultured Desulfuromusa sp. TaxID=219183 RepID=UPI002AA7D688|nr:hypothetical protein [uncultured Desulfuromusa sp.]
MRFVIDETSWRFDALAPDLCVDALETVLDRLDDAQAEGVLVCYSEDLFHTNVFHDKCFYDLYSDDSPIQIPMEVRERVGVLFNRLEKWQDLQYEWPESFFVTVESSTDDGKDAPSIAWAHKQTQDDTANAIGCLIFPGGGETGICNVAVQGVTIPLWFVGDHRQYVEFFRWLITCTTHSPAQLEEFSSSAFPSLDFVPGVFTGMKKMSKPYGELIGKVVSHLGVLSDYGENCFAGLWADAPAKFGAHGVDVSDENGKTKANSVAKKERTITVDGNEVVFWWHSKLERDRDRIHFSPDKLSAGGQLLVGIICRHLTN